MSHSEIKSITAKIILDSRGKPTIEVRLTTNLGKFLASVPSGASRGKYEAREKEARIGVKNINKIIAPKLIDKNPTKQKEIDEFLIKLDGTKNKSRLGGNSILAVSTAVCRAGAKARNLPLWKWISKIATTKSSLPIPSVLLLEGGLHGKGGSDIQEFMIAAPLVQAKEIYQELKRIIKKKYKLRTGLEGGLVLPIENPKEVLNLILTAARTKKIKFILDIAASHSSLKQTLEYYLNLIKQYPILGIEDPFSQDDWQRWQELTSNVKCQMSNVLIIGDDLTVTNPERIKWAQEKKLCNAVIIKPNQIGTVSEAIQAAKLAQSYGWKIIVSHRAGETKDDFIADFACGLGADFIKAGAPTQKERMVKYNRLIKIEEELRSATKFQSTDPQNCQPNFGV